jgi:TonB family protein
MTLLTLPNLAAWSVQVALIVGAALLALRVLRLDAPAVRYTLLRTLLVVCLLLPLVPLLPLADPARAGSAGTAITDIALASADANPATPAWALPAAGLTVVALLLAAGIAVRLGWMALGVVRLRELRRAGEIAPANGEHDDLQALIGTRAALRYVSGLGQPVTFGVRRPVVLLPDSLRSEPPAIQRAVLAHELWHVRRRDWAWAVAEEATRAVFWFHPGMWLLISAIQSTREEVVDELTILTTGSRRSYVDALLAYADRPPIFAATAFARRRHLVHRMVLISKEAVMSAKRVVVCSAALAAIVAFTGWQAVHAFPVVQAPRASGAMSAAPGPVEQRAKPVTPENPVPARTHAVPADYPFEAEQAGASGTVTVRVVLDESGRIAETRAVGLSFRTAGQAAMSFTRLSDEDIDRAMRAAVRTGSGGQVPASGFRAALESMAREATRAVGQWAYAAPSNGPIAFDVNVPVGTAPAASAANSGGSTAAAASGPSARLTAKIGSGSAPPPPPPAPGAANGRLEPARPLTEGALRVGGTIRPPTKIKTVNPVYPIEAKMAGIQGVVILEARIEGDGTVSQAHVLRSIPLLDEAAVDAVRQWEFTPTLLNGNPVPIIMTVTVNFTLQ